MVRELILIHVEESKAIKRLTIESEIAVTRAIRIIRDISRIKKNAITIAGLPDDDDDNDEDLAKLLSHFCRRSCARDRLSIAGRNRKI